MAIDQDLWALWPDDHMCRLGAELEAALNPPCARSDDYEVVKVLAYDEDGEPVKWMRQPRAPITPITPITPSSAIAPVARKDAAALMRPVDTLRSGSNKPARATH